MTRIRYIFLVFTPLFLMMLFAHASFADSNTMNTDATHVHTTSRLNRSEVVPDYAIVVDPTEVHLCIGPDLFFNVDVQSIDGYTPTVPLTSTAPNSTFSVNPVIPGNSSMMTVATNTYLPGDYDYWVQGSDPIGQHHDHFHIYARTIAPAAPALATPNDGTTDVSVYQPTLTWAAAAEASYYDLEIATDMAMTNVIYSALNIDLDVTSHTITTYTLPADTTLYWRVTAVNGCGQATSTTRSFTTMLAFCSTPNVAIPDFDTGGVTDMISVGAVDSISNLDVRLVSIHRWMGDLEFILEHVDTGTTVTLIDRPGFPALPNGCGNRSVDGTADDNGVITDIENHCAGTNPWITGSFVPTEPLSTFDGESFAGDWELTVIDHRNTSQGTLDAWCVQLPASVPTAVDLQDVEVSYGLGTTLLIGVVTLLSMMVVSLVGLRNRQ